MFTAPEPEPELLESLSSLQPSRCEPEPEPDQFTFTFTFMFTAPEPEPELLASLSSTWRAGGGYKYIARLEHLYNLLTKCCNVPYKWC